MKKLVLFMGLLIFFCTSSAMAMNIPISLVTDSQNQIWTEYERIITSTTGADMFQAEIDYFKIMPSESNEMNVLQTQIIAKNNKETLPEQLWTPDHFDVSDIGVGEWGMLSVIGLVGFVRRFDRG